MFFNNPICKFCSLRNLFLSLFFVSFPRLVALAEEPQPFRRDIIDGRDWEYNDQSFIHRFSYRYRPGWQRQWDLEQQGFIITAGSTRSDELYVSNQLLKDIPFDERFFGLIRYQHHEDFDSRYDRLPVGIGINLSEQWSIALLGTIVEDKEDIDQFWEVRWRDNDGNRFRFSIVFADLLYNEKVDDDSEYTKRPTTYFVDGRLTLSEESSLYSWINWTPNAQIEIPQEQKEFDYSQLEGGLRNWIKLSDSWGLQTTIEGQTGNRDTRALGPELKDPQNMDRRNLSGLLEISDQLQPNLQAFLGLRYFFLSEKYEKTANPGQSGELLRREPMPYTGVVWNLSEKLVFWPTAYTSILNNQNYDPNEPDEQSESKRVIGKLTLPFEYRFSDRAAATFNTTFQTAPRGPFGGWNIQFLVYL